MKKTILYLFTLCLIVVSHSAQAKKIKIKGDKTVSFVYEKDSSILAHKENKRIVNALYNLCSVLKEDNFDGFLNLLSPNTKEKLPEIKFPNKYKKLKAYAVNLIGKINVQSIYLLKNKTFETDPVYVCSIRLPEGQKIKKRSGFDPLSKIKTTDIQNYFAMTFVATPVGYRVVIVH